MITARTIAAEARFVESGHLARLDTERHCFKVSSDTKPGVVHEVRIGAQGVELRATCTCPAGRFARHGVAVPCRHAGGVFHRGEREGWAAWSEGRWVLAGDLRKAVAA